MQPDKNGINMLSVKRANRKSILSLMYRRGQISRKNLAQELGLTPAAITLITTDLLNEKLIRPASRTTASHKKGRKEVMLELSASRYIAVGVSISNHQAELICIDFANHIYFEETVDTAACKHRSKDILFLVAERIQKNLKESRVLDKRILVGIGIGVIGMVDMRRGISVNSYRVWEKDVPVVFMLRPLLPAPVLLINNVCALAHGETLLAREPPNTDMFFVKYGPGVGATQFSPVASASIYDYQNIEIGHLIVNNYGLPCFCGNEGCLETIVGYDAVQRSIAGLISRKESPVLYALTGGERGRLRMHHILQAYNENDPLAVRAMDRIVHALGLAIKNATRLYDPQTVVLFGEPFRNRRFCEALQKEFTSYAGMCRQVFSRHDARLEVLGPALAAITLFFENGGIL